MSEDEKPKETESVHRPVLPERRWAPNDQVERAHRQPTGDRLPRSDSDAPKRPTKPRSE